MVVFGGYLDLIVVIFLVLVFAEYVKIRAKVDKQFRWIAASAIWFLLAVGFGVFSGIFSDVATWGSFLFQVIGWLFLLIGSIWTAIELVK